MNGSGVWWMVTGGIVALLLGYVLGREHAKMEVRSTLSKKMPSRPW